ncbi:MAG: hypothetical protein ACTSU6_01205 [Candidatus Njordarchaeales archaeon]
MWIGRKIDVDNFEAIDTATDTLLDKNERIELYQKYLPEKPATNNGLSKVCKDIIENRLIGTKRLHMWLKNKNPVNAQQILKNLFCIFAWRLIKRHSTGDIYNFIRISNKLISHAIALQFSELSKYIKSWRDKILKENLKKIIQIRREYIKKSKDNQKSDTITDIPEITDITEKPDTTDKNEIIDQIVNLLLKLKE